MGEYARRIKRHGAVALAELVHCGKEKVPFGPGQEAIGPIETTNLAGVKVRPMNEDDMARIARDFAVSATYMQKAGFDGVLIHGGHGFLFTQFLSPHDEHPHRQLRRLSGEPRPLPPSRF